MELVINIDENTYKHFKDNCYSRIDIIAVHNALDYGIPLPKGHGDLIDRNEVEKLEEKICTTECSCCSSDKCFYEYAEPIIKTDRRTKK